MVIFIHFPHYNVFLGPLFLGIFDDSNISNLMIKLDNFCFLYDFDDHKILIYVTPLSLEIIDSCGFLSNHDRHSHELLSFLALYSNSRILLTNPTLKKSHVDEIALYRTYVILRNNGHNFSDIISKLI